MLSSARHLLPVGFLSAGVVASAAAAAASCTFVSPAAALTEPRLPSAPSAKQISTDARGISGRPADEAAAKDRPAHPTSSAEILRDRCAVFDGRTLKKVPGGLQEIVTEVLEKGFDCLCVGEVHDDPVAHVVEVTLLQELITQTEARGRRPLSLSLEFFERDVQGVMDEYLLGVCREQDLLKDGRAWNNYPDYRQMIELCRGHRLPVVCANAPRRHVSLAGREGVGSLSRLPEASKALLPPLPYPGASGLYADKFAWTMRSMQRPPSPVEKDPQEGSAQGDQLAAAPSSSSAGPEAPGECPYIGLSGASSNMLDAQCLWDASMAHSIHRELLRLRAATAPDAATAAAAGPHRAGGSTAQPVVMHVCGKFHCENHLGIPERLQQMPLDGSGGDEVVGGTEAKTRGTRTLVVCVVPSAMKHIMSQELPRAAQGMADYVVLGDSGLPRSFEVQHPV